jgi:hypothetical protein
MRLTPPAFACHRGDYRRGMHGQDHMDVHRGNGRISAPTAYLMKIGDDTICRMIAVHNRPLMFIDHEATGVDGFGAKPHGKSDFTSSSWRRRDQPACNLLAREAP